MEDRGKGMRDRARRLTADESTTGMGVSVTLTNDELATDGPRPSRSKFKCGGKIAMGQNAARRLDQYARGGSVKKAKGKTVINIVIGDQDKAPPAPAMIPPPAMAMPPMPPGPPPGAAGPMPGGPPPGGPPVGPMNRGGRVGFKRGGKTPPKPTYHNIRDQRGRFASGGSIEDEPAPYGSAWVKAHGLVPDLSAPAAPDSGSSSGIGASAAPSGSGTLTPAQQRAHAYNLNYGAMGRNANAMMDRAAGIGQSLNTGGRVHRDAGGFLPELPMPDSKALVPAPGQWSTPGGDGPAMPWTKPAPSAPSAPALNPWPALSRIARLGYGPALGLSAYFGPESLGPAETGEDPDLRTRVEDAAETERHSGIRGGNAWHQPAHPPSTGVYPDPVRVAPRRAVPMPPPRPAAAQAEPDFLHKLISGQWSRGGGFEDNSRPYSGARSDSIWPGERPSTDYLYNRGGRVKRAFGGPLGAMASAASSGSWNGGSSNGSPWGSAWGHGAPAGGNAPPPGSMPQMPQMQWPSMPQGLPPQVQTMWQNGQNQFQNFMQGLQGAFNPANLQMPTPGQMPAGVPSAPPMSQPGQAPTPNGTGAAATPNPGQQLMQQLTGQTQNALGQARQNWQQMGRGLGMGNGMGGFGHGGFRPPGASGAAPGGFKRGGAVTAGGRSGLGRLEKAARQKKGDDC